MITKRRVEHATLRTASGTGTLNGAGNYGFLLTATDGKLVSGTATDLFRIKIWDKDSSNAVVYDNQMGQSEDSRRRGSDSRRRGSGLYFRISKQHSPVALVEPFDRVDPERSRNLP